jgi:hypothetical protein
MKIREALGIPNMGHVEVFMNSKAWCSFERTADYRANDERIVFQCYPMKRFKPLGLMLFGVSKGMTVQCYIRNMDGLDVASYGTLPAQIFARAYSYEKLYQMLKEGEANLNEWADFAEVDVGNVLRIVLGAPRPGMLEEVQVAMWGMTHQL